MEKWRLVHNYRRAVDRGLTLPILCRCGSEYIWAPGADADPVLSCYSCNSTIIPGLYIWDQIEKALNE